MIKIILQNMKNSMAGDGLKKLMIVFLKVIAVNGKLIFTGKKSVVDVCQKHFSNKSGNWFMDVVNFRKLDEILKEEGYRIKTAHPFFYSQG